MNSNDMNILEKLNERYGPTNMTGFKLVGKGTDRDTVLRHFAMDLEILRTSNVGIKDPVRVLYGDNVIDICSHDNGTPVSYYFTQDADFAPEDILKDMGEICEIFEISLENLR